MISSLLLPKHKVHFRESDHKYFSDEAMTKPVVGVSELITHFGYSDYERLRKMGAPVDEAAAYGDAVHLTCRYSDEGRLKDYDQQIDPELKAWKGFIEKNKIDFVVIEQPLISKIWGFAGTPDRFSFDGDLFDIKTCGPQRHHEIQTALYKILIEENFDIKVRARFTVELKEKIKLHHHKDRIDESIAKSMLMIYGDKIKKGIL